MSAVRVEPQPTDEELMLDLAHGHQEALGPLYTRYASLVFHLGVQSLDRPAAEELVQEVFLTIWRGAGSFDASQGPFRPWLLRLAHWKILNELRRRRRRPVDETSGDDDNGPLDAMADDEPGPEERAWQSEHERILQSALESLPPKQRQAVSMAFLEDMTHEQVASALAVPLGTAKTRIRSGLQILRMQLAPVAASLLGLALVAVGYRYIQSQRAFERDETALGVVTTSDVAPLRLTPPGAQPTTGTQPAPGIPANAHANYRSRPGIDLVVLNVEALPGPPAGRTYQAWAGHADQWTSLGTFTIDAQGNARLIAQSPDLLKVPDTLEITLELTGNPQNAPTGPVVLVWPQ